MLYYYSIFQPNLRSRKVVYKIDTNDPSLLQIGESQGDSELIKKVILHGNVLKGKFTPSSQREYLRIMVEIQSEQIIVPDIGIIIEYTGSIPEHIQIYCDSDKNLCNWAAYLAREGLQSHWKSLRETGYPETPNFPILGERDLRLILCWLIRQINTPTALL